MTRCSLALFMASILSSCVNDEIPDELFGTWTSNIEVTLENNIIDDVSLKSFIEVEYGKLNYEFIANKAYLSYSNDFSFSKEIDIYKITSISGVHTIDQTMWWFDKNQDLVLHMTDFDQKKCFYLEEKLSTFGKTIKEYFCK